MQHIYSICFKKLFLRSKTKIEISIIQYSTYYVLQSDIEVKYVAKLAEVNKLCSNLSSIIAFLACSTKHFQTFFPTVCLVLCVCVCVCVCMLSNVLYVANITLHVCGSLRGWYRKATSLLNFWQEANEKNSPKSHRLFLQFQPFIRFRNFWNTRMSQLLCYLTRCISISVTHYVDLYQSL